MFIGSDNQFRNLYVMKTYKSSESAISAVGDLTLKVDTTKSNVYLVYKDTEDTITSDLISIKNFLYAKSTKAADMARKLNSQLVTLNADPVNNGKQIADMEWFYHGTRGDIYREATYPDNFDFKPLVDETKAYHTLDIHFAYVGPGVEVAKSERTITVVCATTAELNKLITALKTATGVDAGAVS